MATRIELKRGDLGDVWRDADGATVTRDLAAAPRGWRWLARHLARREAAALIRLHGIDGIPELVSLERNRVVRSYLPGLPMHRAAPRTPAYYRRALRLLRRMHQRRVVHNDAAKEANWLCDDSLEPALVDFQLAICFRRRSRLFRTLAREDLRHLLKHKRCYLPDALTARERVLLDRPLWPSRVWRRTGKPVYRLITRGLLGWSERAGPEERERARGKRR